MNTRAWVVGMNEGAILGEGWYGRRPDWFGLPFRESFGRASLRVPDLEKGGKIVFLLSSCLALHTDRQTVRIQIGEQSSTLTLSRPDTGRPWKTFTIEVPKGVRSEPLTSILLETDEWRHGNYEPIPDFREVGLLFAGVFRIRG
jgi:hypothetical protein